MFYRPSIPASRPPAAALNHKIIMLMEKESHLHKVHAKPENHLSPLMDKRFIIFISVQGIHNASHLSIHGFVFSRFFYPVPTTVIVEPVSHMSGSSIASPYPPFGLRGIIIIRLRENEKCPPSRSQALLPECRTEPIRRVPRTQQYLHAV